MKFKSDVNVSYFAKEKISLYFWKWLFGNDKGNFTLEIDCFTQVIKLNLYLKNLKQYYGF